MTKNYPGEVWKSLEFDFEYTNDCRIEVSNYGRIRTFNKLSDGNILNGSMINGYRIIRLKFFTPRSAVREAYFEAHKQQISKMFEKIKELRKEKDEIKVEQAMALLDAYKKDVSKKYVEDLKSRTIHYHSLIHRLVADHFCKKPSELHTIVGHTDFNKLNNKSTNLKWMTPEENYVHQQKSPLVIAKKSNNTQNGYFNTKVAKLTITKVMLLKKMLNQGKPMRTLVKQFKVTETQILRIKRGENWANVEAAS